MKTFSLKLKNIHLQLYMLRIWQRHDLTYFCHDYKTIYLKHASILSVKEKCQCKVGEYACKGGKLCIPAGKICDGASDCPYNDDEMTCGWWTCLILKYACIRVCIYAYVSALTRVCMCLHLCIYASTCMQVYLCALVLKWMRERIGSNL